MAILNEYKTEQLLKWSDDVMMIQGLLNILNHTSTVVTEAKDSTGYMVVFENIKYNILITDDCVTIHKFEQGFEPYKRVIQKKGVLIRLLSHNLHNALEESVHPYDFMTEIRNWIIARRSKRSR